MSYEYQVYYDYEINGIWVYNSIYHIHLIDKGQHDIADEIVTRKLRKEYSNFRITRVDCD